MQDEPVTEVRHPAPLARTWRPRTPVTAAGLSATLSPMRRGGGDPAHRRVGDTLWRAMRTPVGTATIRLDIDAAAGTISALAWGDGAAWAVDGAPALVGEGDDDAGFAELAAGHPVLREAWRRHRTWRVPRSQLVLEALVPAILEQKVTGTEAHRSWATLLRWYGEPAPVPAGSAPEGMRVPPSAQVWRRVPSWAWHRAGVDAKRSSTVLQACRVAGRLEATLSLPHGEAERLMCTVSGIGVWTAAEVRQRAHGDADAVSVGDFHLCKRVGWALVGRPVDDAGMLELLAPYAGHRYRVQRLVELHAGGPASAAGLIPPRRAPRFSPRDYRSI